LIIALCIRLIIALCRTELELQPLSSLLNGQMPSSLNLIKVCSFLGLMTHDQNFNPRYLSPDYDNEGSAPVVCYTERRRLCYANGEPVYLFCWSGVGSYAYSVRPRLELWLRYANEGLSATICCVERACPLPYHTTHVADNPSWLRK
jgi:hypothetical protein